MLNQLGMLLMTSLYLSQPQGGIADTPFVQEYHEAYPIAADERTNDVRSVAVAGDGTVWVATAAGIFALSKGENAWRQPQGSTEAAPAFAVFADETGQVWAGAWNGLYAASFDGMTKQQGIDGPVTALCKSAGGLIALGPDGIWRQNGSSFEHEPLRCAQSVRAAIAEGDALWVATGMSLNRFSRDGDTLYQRDEDIVSADVRDVAMAKDGRLWAACLGGITIYENGTRLGQLTLAEGMPSVYPSCIACAPDGIMWIGTDYGVTRYDGKKWSLRHSRRWLLDDDVRDVAFDAEGSAWVATAKGVSAIKRKSMTLAEKADYFQKVCMERHVREPWLVERCRLRTPGDLTTFEPEDDDNDGGYTAMYMVMEAFRYAVTKSPEARENAKKAFDTSLFLQTVTETPGFIARTVVPATWTEMHDMGDLLSPQETAERRIEDPRYKPVAERWRKSKDGKWLWKGDTSSDETTAHFFGWGYYYDLAADTEEEKARVRNLVSRLMDYIIDNGYVLVDIDGKHTRWGVWAPERLNEDPHWAAERGINSLEILSYLKTAYHITGNEKYQQEYLRLFNEHGYGKNALVAKTFAVSWRTHIDDELLSFAYPGLLRYETDPEMLKVYRQSIDRWYEGVRNDGNPMFNFIYASLTNTPPNMSDSVELLRDTPLDLINWTVDNSKREDMKLVRSPEIEPLQTNRVAPASERGVIRWDKNPWMAVHGDGGISEWAPTFWLFPYWMGRYCGYLSPSAKS